MHDSNKLSKGVNCKFWAVSIYLSYCFGKNVSFAFAPCVFWILFFPYILITYVSLFIAFSVCWQMLSRKKSGLLAWVWYGHLKEHIYGMHCTFLSLGNGAVKEHLFMNCKTRNLLRLVLNICKVMRSLEFVVKILYW